MRRECKRCGKKYNKKHERCPQCGELASYQTSYRSYSTLEQKIPESIQQIDKLQAVDESQQVEKLQEVNKTVPRYNANVQRQKDSGDEERAYDRDTEMGNQREKIIVQKPEIRWGWMILLGVLILGIYYGGKYYSYYSRYPVGQEDIMVHQIHKGQSIETNRIQMQVESAHRIESEWLERYLLDGYQLIGVQMNGQIKQEIGGHEEPGTFYMSYEKDGKEVYQEVIGDWDVSDYLYEKGYNVINGYNTFQIKEEGMVFFCVENGVEVFKLHYQEPVWQIFGIGNTVEVYEVELDVEGGMAL